MGGPCSLQCWAGLAMSSPLSVPCSENTVTGEEALQVPHYTRLIKGSQGHCWQSWSPWLSSRHPLEGTHSPEMTVITDSKPGAYVGSCKLEVTLFPSRPPKTPSLITSLLLIQGHKVKAAGAILCGPGGRKVGVLVKPQHPLHPAPWAPSRSSNSISP